jgi:membrane protein implicated in regulation of membrane protease activity
LTLATKASAGSAAASLFGTIGFGPPTPGIFALVLSPLLAWAFQRRLSGRVSRPNQRAGFLESEAGIWDN